MSSVWARCAAWLRLPFLSRGPGAGRWVEPSSELLRAILGAPISLPTFDIVERPAYAAPVQETAGIADAPTAPAHVFEDDSFEESPATPAPIPFPGRAA